jgi:predicted TIM-barrel fold metal-dependent hydrolase
MFEELLADVTGGHNVRATVYVQANAMARADGPPELASLGETEFVNGVAARSASGQYGPARLCAGIVGHVDLMRGAAIDAVLERHQRAAGDRFKGIRNSSVFHDDPRLAPPVHPAPPPGLLRRPDFRAGFACLAPRGLSYDAWSYFTQMDDVEDLARVFPDTAIIINHLGGILGMGPYLGRRDEVFAVWKVGIERLARCPNITMKIGGLGMRILGFGFKGDPRPPSSERLATLWRPYAETAIAAFGADRCMFESNFPVDRESYSYAVGWNAFKRIAAGCLADEKRMLFAGTASRVYRLEA